MTNKPKAIFVHQDLDGVVSYMIMKWYYPNANFEVNLVRNVFDFREQYLNWCLNHSSDDYEKIFILDLDVSGNEDLIDKDNFVIVDHHPTHEKAVYEHATAFVKEYTSCAKLLWKILSAKFPDVEISKPRKTLIALADDYDSYTLKAPICKDLNTVYWYLNNNFNTFSKDFNNGFAGFNLQQQSIIKFHASEFKKYRDNIKEIYIGDVTIGDGTYKACSFFANKYINDLAEYFFKAEDVDIVFMYNPKLNKVYVRAKKECPANVGELCETWGGGGHAGAGGAPVGEGFIELSKTLQTKIL